jgi:uncharacterized protein YbjQ (UPF0145 family)
MKSRGVLRVAVPAAVLFAIALLCSCATTNLTSNRTGWSDYATVAIKDYTVVGIVRVVSEEVTRRGFLGIAHSRTGSQVTYDLLVSEAKRLGADDIINVRIDRTDKSLHGIFDWLVGYTEKYAYTANALAIKYTQAVAGSFADGAGSPSGMGGGPGLTEVAALQGAAEADATPATPQHQSRDGQNRRQKTMATAQ